MNKGCIEWMRAILIRAVFWTDQPLGRGWAYQPLGSVGKCTSVSTTKESARTASRSSGLCDQHMAGIDYDLIDPIEELRGMLS
jgi:hypothetical protein